MRVILTLGLLVALAGCSGCAGRNRALSPLGSARTGADDRPKPPDELSIFSNSVMERELFGHSDDDSEASRSGGAFGHR
jgi:hypothetical protein